MGKGRADYWTRLLTLAKPAPAVHAALVDLKRHGGRLEEDGAGGLVLVCEAADWDAHLEGVSSAVLALLDELSAGRAA